MAVPWPHLEWPWFDDSHRELGARVRAWAAARLKDPEPADVDAACRTLVSELAEAGLLRYCVPAVHGGALAELDARSLCVIREALSYASGLADFAFALQGLGSGPITRGGSDEQRRAYLPRVARGEAIAAFALSEPDAGSDVAAIAATAHADGDGYVIDGTKTWISNGGIADFYVVFARTGPDMGSRGLSAFIVDAVNPGIAVEARIEAMAAHPLATMRLHHCRVPATSRIGDEGEGFKIAMRTLDVFRPSVAAAALGLARRALDEAVRRALDRRMFGGRLADLQLTEASVGDMAAEVDAAALLTYRAAWLHDVLGRSITTEAAMAKMIATESAQRVIDRSLQMFGGFGVVKGSVVERLYREIRALRIYEGATEVQRLIVGRRTIAAAADQR